MKSRKAVQKDKLFVSYFFKEIIRRSDSVALFPIFGSPFVISAIQIHTGAPESILDRCSSIMLPDGTLEPLTETSKKLILGKMLDMAGGARA